MNAGVTIKLLRTRGLFVVTCIASSILFTACTRDGVGGPLLFQTASCQSGCTSVIEGGRKVIIEAEEAQLIVRGAWFGDYLGLEFSRVAGSDISLEAMAIGSSAERVQPQNGLKRRAKIHLQGVRDTGLRPVEGTWPLTITRSVTLAVSLEQEALSPTFDVFLRFRVGAQRHQVILSTTIDRVRARERSGDL